MLVDNVQCAYCDAEQDRVAFEFELVDDDTGRVDGWQHHCPACGERFTTWRKKLMDEESAKQLNEKMAWLEVGPEDSELYRNQFYITPESLALAQLRMLAGDMGPDLIPQDELEILDAGFGFGAYGRMARKVWPQAHIVGIDIEPSRIGNSPPGSFLKAYDELIIDNFLTHEFDRPFHLVIGNPPYKDVAEKFIHRAHEVLLCGGRISFLMKAAIGHTNGRWDRLYAAGRMYYREAKVVPRVPFVGYGGDTAPAEYSAWFWRNGYGGHEWAMSGKLGWDKSRMDGQEELL